MHSALLHIFCTPRSAVTPFASRTTSSQFHCIRWMRLCAALSLRHEAVVRMLEWSVQPVHRDLPYLVDQLNEKCATKLQFLTHAHKDHMQKIEDFATLIVCTALTKQLVQLRHPRLAGHDE